MSARESVSRPITFARRSAARVGRRASSSGRASRTTSNGTWATVQTVLDEVEQAVVGVVRVVDDPHHRVAVELGQPLEPGQPRAEQIGAGQRAAGVGQPQQVGQRRQQPGPLLGIRDVGLQRAGPASSACSTRCRPRRRRSGRGPRRSGPRTPPRRRRPGSGRGATARRWTTRRGSSPARGRAVSCRRRRRRTGSPAAAGPPRRRRGTSPSAHSARAAARRAAPAPGRCCARRRRSP